MPLSKKKLFDKLNYMSLSIGIVGLPNVGKSTLFNALTKKQVSAENYPFCTINPNVGVVKVPDERLLKLAAISKPQKIINATIEFVDIAGLVKGASQGEGLGNQFLSHIRECDAICEVVRNFKNKDIIHVNGEVNPENDKSIIDLELILADLASAQKGLGRISKNAKSGDKKIIKEKNILEIIIKHLELGKPIRELNLEDEDKKFLNSFNFLTAKPIIYVLNIDDYERIDHYLSWNEKIISINAKTEQEIASLSEEEQTEYLKELGINQSGLDKLIQASYSLLDLITFFTTGSDETRAWTIYNGAKAPEAAGIIHSDFEKNFIRSEIINWEDFVMSGGEVQAREKGLIRTEGRSYIVKDGDVCHFLVNR